MIEMEYADGGNLAEFLVKQTVRMEEKDILGSNQFSSPKCSYLKCADTHCRERPSVISECLLVIYEAQNDWFFFSCYF